MLTRLLNVLLASGVFAITGACDRQSTAADVNGFVILEMTGELATEYQRLTSPVEPRKVPHGLKISTMAAVAQHLENGQLRIEHSMPVWENKVQVRLVTLSAIVETSAVKNSNVPKETATYSSPEAPQAGGTSVTTKSESNVQTFELADLKRVKLRKWKLETEIGN
jgi:hypothetical protein